MQNPLEHHRALLTRRHFLGRAATGIGIGALASLLEGESGVGDLTHAPAVRGMGLPGLPHHAPRARRVVYLFQSGGPSQQDLFDPKPLMVEHHGHDLRERVAMTQRITGMTKGQEAFPIAGSCYGFAQHGDSGAWVSELLPHIAGISDHVCYIRSMHTEAINHDPAITFFQTGSELPGRPSAGAWAAYGLGSECQDLPAFVVMASRGTGRPNCQPLYDRLWGSGFLPTGYAGVKFMGTGDPVLYLTDPDGFDRVARRRMLDALAELNAKKLEDYGDPEIDTRIQNYELAFRMQSSVPDLTDISDEPEHILAMYGPDVRRRGTYAHHCLLARRMLERGVRFVQLFHMGWDQHKKLPQQLPGQCSDADQPSAALVRDLQQRGLLDDTLVVWGGEFGRTTYCQGTLRPGDYGRDHHPRCFTIWLAGAGVRPGLTYGKTDAYCYDVVENPVHVHDLNATMLHLLGVDHTRLTFRFQGRDYRLTDVHGRVVSDILA